MKTIIKLILVIFFCSFQLMSVAEKLQHKNITIELEIEQPDELQVRIDTKYAENEKLQLNAVVTGGLPNYSYYWYPETGLSNPTIANPEVTLENTSIKYTLEVQDYRGCYAFASYPFNSGAKQIENKEQLAEIIIEKVSRSILLNFTDYYQQVSIQLINLQGQSLAFEKLGEVLNATSYRIFTHSLASGIYFIKLSSCDKYQTQIIIL